MKAMAPSPEQPDVCAAVEIERIRKAVRATRETLLANLAIIGEIPAPTFREDDRIQFLRDRFTECGLVDISVDEVGNGFGVLRGTDDTRHLLALAHTDTAFPATVDHAATILPESVTGPGVGDNSLGVALLATLPDLLGHLEIVPRANWILMGGVRSLGRGDLGGLRFFLDNTDLAIEGAVAVEGVQLGRLSYSSIAMLRGEIACETPAEYDWTRLGAVGAIRTLCEVVRRIDAIRRPNQPQSTIVFGSIEGGQSYNRVATRSRLRFEIRSEADDLADEIAADIQSIVEEVASETGARLRLDVFARRRSGGIAFGHPLVRFVRDTMSALAIEPRIAPSTSELAALIEHDVPAVTLGLTHGENLHMMDECIFLEPLERGVTQVLATLLALDRGVCDEG